jgi:uncharacterized protein
VTGCGQLGIIEIATALDAGVLTADRLMAEGLIHRAALFLGNQGRVVADVDHIIPALLETRHYA